MDYIENQITNLQPSRINTENGSPIIVKHTLIPTMIGRKVRVRNAITGANSTKKFYLCDATCKQFNNSDKFLLRIVDDSVFQFGLSTLHTLIRLFGCLLHLSYKFGIKN